MPRLLRPLFARRREWLGVLCRIAARLIRKVYEADPLECPKCKGPMRVIALID